MTETGVVVVGAGAAGLAAGLRLAERGVPFVVVEAKDRVGGRAFTDTAAFGVPFDHGCHWLHSASLNPFRTIADRLGFRYTEGSKFKMRRLLLDGRRADAATAEASWQALEAALDAVHAAGAAGRDVAAADVMPDPGRWRPLVDHWFGLFASQPPEKVSTLDLHRYRDTLENFPVLDGYGALVAANAASVPVRLAVRATRVDWSGSHVAVETSAGTLRAASAIVTLPTNVIAGGGLAFTPALPADVGEAFAACPCGSAEKVAFLLDRPIEAEPDSGSTTVFQAGDPPRPPVALLVNHAGRPLVVGHIGGDAAAALERAGPAAMADLVAGALADAYGSDVRRRIVATVTTGWTSDPDIRGAYSCALPGKADLRARLAEPLGERLLFAGEAVSADFFSTAHGAHLTGLAAADRAADIVRGAR